MEEKHKYGEYKKTPMTAYERRKLNSQKIAQVKFDYSAPEIQPSTMQHNPKEKVWFKKQYGEIQEKRKNSTPIWTQVDQQKENELWDE